MSWPTEPQTVASADALVEATPVSRTNQASNICSFLEHFTPRIKHLRKWLLAGLLVVTLFPSAYLCWQARDGSTLGYFQDDELYLTAAKSLIRMHTYNIPSLPGQPFQTKYPPLYPLLLSVIWKLSPVFPANLQWFVLLDWCLWAGFLAVAFMAFRQLQFAWTAQWGALVLLASNGVCQILATHLMPEALFSTLVLAAILFAEHASRIARPVPATVCAAIAGGCAFLAKTAALPIALTVPLVFILRRQYLRALCFAAVVAPFIAGWTIWAGAHRGQSPDPVLLYYVDYLGFYRLNVHWRDLAALLKINFPYLQAAFAYALPTLPRVMTPVSIILTAICLVGTVRLFRRTRFLHAAVFGIAYLLQMLAWNFSPNGRFLYPLFPFLVAGFIFEVSFAVGLVKKELSSRWDLPIRRISGLALGSMLVGVLLTSVSNARAMGSDQFADFRRNTAGRRAAFAWIEKNLPTDAKFAAYDDVGLYLYTGRQGMRNQVMSRAYLLDDIEGVQRPIAGIAEFARQHGLAYVLWSRDDYAIDGVLWDAHLRERLLAKNQGLRLIYNTMNVRIYRVNQ